MCPSAKKRISDDVNDRIVARVLGLTGLPEPNDVAITRAAADVFREATRSPNNFNCLVREIVNGAVRASRFTRLAPRETARATILGMLRGAKCSGASVPAVASLACERLLWSTAALGEDLGACAHGIVEGAKQGATQLNGEGRGVLQVIAKSVLHAVDDIDPDKVEEARLAVAKIA